MRALDCDIVKKKHVAKQESLSLTQHLLLEIMQLLPIFTVAGMLKLTHNANPTMIVFFIGVTVLPLIYCYLYKQSIKSILFGDGMDRIKLQIQQGLLGCFGILAMVMGSYYAFLGLDPGHHSWIMSRNIPINKTFVDTATFFVVFSFLNPIMEELFWRAFLLKSYRHREFAFVSITIHYAIYHFFSIQYIIDNYLLSAAATTAILWFGAVLMYLRERYGMVTAMLTHVGGDLAVALLATHIYTGYQI